MSNDIVTNLTVLNEKYTNNLYTNLLVTDKFDLSEIILNQLNINELVVQEAILPVVTPTNNDRYLSRGFTGTGGTGTGTGTCGIGMNMNVGWTTKGRARTMVIGNSNTSPNAQQMLCYQMVIGSNNVHSYQGDPSASVDFRNKVLIGNNTNAYNNANILNTNTISLVLGTFNGHIDSIDPPTTTPLPKKGVSLRLNSYKNITYPPNVFSGAYLVTCITDTL